jgi:integrase
MHVGRKRKCGNPLALEKRVYPRRGKFWYVHRDGTWESLGPDVERANERARVYNDPAGRYGTLGYFLDRYIADAENGRLHKNKKPRTIEDNKKEAVWLKTAFDKINPLDLVRKPDLIATYRDERGAPIRANRELSLLSAVYTWLIEKGHLPGLNVNPVLLIKRNPQKPKERYVEDAEFTAVYGLAIPSVRMAMDLCYRTLQRPGDVLRAERSWLRNKTVAGTAKPVLSVTQSKTDRRVDIEITPEIESALSTLDKGDVVRLTAVLVHGRDGSAYTEDGLGAMLRRYCLKAGVKTFGLMDVRAKGATDMYLAGVPLERIQMLMGHKSMQTTEIYIKRLLATVSTVAPNTVKMGL